MDRSRNRSPTARASATPSLPRAVRISATAATIRTAIRFHERRYCVDADDLLADILANPLLDGLTLSGGEPFMQAEVCAYLARPARQSGLNVIVYSGYT